MKRIFIVFIFVAALFWLRGPDVYSAPQFRNIIERGEYMAAAAGCVSCHTSAQGLPFSGGLRLETGFGPLFTPNITPDMDTGIGQWTSEEFYRAMHDGVGRDGRQLYPAFPYPYYTRLSREDIDAIFAYLKSLPPVHHEVEVNRLNFPFRIRLLLHGWKLLFFRRDILMPDLSQGLEWNRGAYLVEAAGHCAACHTPHNKLGAPDHSQAYAGARIENWYAPNITSHREDGIGTWSEDELVEYFKTGVTPSGAVSVGPMDDVITNSLSRLDDSDLRAIAVYIKSLPPKSTRTDDTGYNVRQARRLYLQHCAGCHHPNGVGRPNQIPPLAENSSVETEDPANVLNVVMFGIPARAGRREMPSFDHVLTDTELALVINYVRTSWGNRAPLNVTPEDVRKWREFAQP